MNKKDEQVFNKFQRICAVLVKPLVWGCERLEMREANKRDAAASEKARLERLAQSIASSKNFRR